MMRMLFVINGLPSMGNNCHTFNLARILSRSHAIDLVCFDGDTQYPTDRSCFSRIVTIPVETKNAVVKGLRSVFEQTPYCVLTYESRSMISAIDQLCHEARYDAVLFEPLAMAEYIPYVNGCPKIVFPVDATSRIKEQKYHAASGCVDRCKRYIDYRIVRKYEEHVYERADAVVFVSEHDSEYTLRHVKSAVDRVYTMPLGVDLDYFHPAPERSSAKPSLAFLGSMAHYPNHHGMLWFYDHVWKDLKLACPELRLYIVGSGPGPEIQNLAKQDGDIAVTGFVEDVRPYIWEATVFVSPLQIGTGTKNKMLQAMSMGEAIVASPLDTQGICGIEDGKDVLVAQSPREFIDKIVQLLKDAGLRQRLGGSARHLVERHHSLERKAERFMDIVWSISPACRDASTSSCNTDGEVPHVG